MSQKRQPDIQVRTLALGFSGGHVLDEHTHDWDQLIYASEGVVTVRAASGTWVVPPQRAVWVPAGVGHAVEMSGRVALRTLYLVRGLARAMPSECCVVRVSPLLRELILHAVALGMLDRRAPAQDHLIDVIVDQLGELPTIPLDLAMPRDRRARAVAERLVRDPAQPAGLGELARGAGASKRTVERLFREQVGTTFGRWRQQLRLMCALRLLAAGEPVTTVALRVGYDSPSAFISMFRRALGTTPSRYYAEADPPP